MTDLSTLSKLVETIAARSNDSSGKSYTAKLLSKGTIKCAEKFGEESIELITASLGDNGAHVAAEAGDVLYHFLVLLQSRGIPIDQVMAELEARTAQSGLEEKASRSKE